MQITLTKEQVKEAFGELRFMGADNCYRYDKDSKKKTEAVSYTHLDVYKRQEKSREIYLFGIFHCRRRNYVEQHSGNAEGKSKAGRRGKSNVLKRLTVYKRNIVPYDNCQSACCHAADCTRKC